MLVTGCRRGIGAAAAVAFADAGADVIGVSATLEADGGEVGSEVEKRGVAFRGHACDFADRAALYRLLDELRSRAADRRARQQCRHDPSQPGGGAR